MWKKWQGHQSFPLLIILVKTLQFWESQHRRKKSCNLHLVTEPPSQVINSILPLLHDPQIQNFQKLLPRIMSNYFSLDFDIADITLCSHRLLYAETSNKDSKVKNLILNKNLNQKQRHQIETWHLYLSKINWLKIWKFNFKELSIL
jgi:hypothetical protein